MHARYIPLLAALVSAPAMAGDTQIVGPGSALVAVRQTVGTTSEVITEDGSAGKALLVPARATSGDLGDTIAVVQATGAARCVWSLDTFGDISSGALTSSTSPSGFSLPAVGSRYDGRPEASAIKLDAQAPNGICSVPVTTLAGQVLYAPCNGNGDCAAPYGGGTCTAYGSTTARQRWLLGAVLQCASDSGSISIDVRLERLYRAREGGQ